MSFNTSYGTPILNLAIVNDEVVDTVGNTLTSYNVTSTSGIVNEYAMKFTQADNSRIFINTLATQLEAEDFTITFWINCSAVRYIGSQWDSVISQFYGNSSQGTVFNVGTNANNSKKVFFCYYNGGTYYDEAYSNNPSIVDSTNHYMTVTRNGGTVYFFVDGSIIDTITLASSTFSFQQPSGNYTFINTNNTQSSYGMNEMVLDDVYIIKGKAIWTEDFDVPDAPLKDYLAKNYMDKQNLKLYDTLIKEYINTQIDNMVSAITYSEIDDVIDTVFT